MIELFEQNERKADRQSSKGNQLKWENEVSGTKRIVPDMKDLPNIWYRTCWKNLLWKNEFVQYDYEQIKI